MDKRLDSLHTVQANEIRSTGPVWNHWPADLPQVSYVAADGKFLCVTCANNIDPDKLDKDCPDDKWWRIIGAQVNKDDTLCAHCNRTITAKDGQ